MTHVRKTEQIDEDCFWIDMIMIEESCSCLLEKPDCEPSNAQLQTSFKARFCDVHAQLGGLQRKSERWVVWDCIGSLAQHYLMVVQNELTIDLESVCAKPCYVLHALTFSALILLPNEYH